MTDQNEGPEISGQQSLSFTENQTTERVLATYTATDPEDPSALITRWSLTGTDAGDFTISENGQLTFRNVPDHERPADSRRDNVYNLSVRASDGRNYGYLDLEVTLIVARTRTSFTISETGVLSFASSPNYESPTDSGSDNVYDLPRELRHAGRGRHRDRPERGAGDIGAAEPLLYREPDYGAGAGHLHRRDPEDTSAVITRWSLTGTDAGDFTISENGPADLPEHPGPREARRLQARQRLQPLRPCSDGRNYGYLEVTVIVEDVNEAPTITTTSKTAFSYRENGTATSTPSRPPILTERHRLVGVGHGRGRLHHQRDGRALLASSPNYESPTDSGRDNVYEVTVVAKDDAFNSGTLDVVVTVTDQNEGPEISGQQSLSFTENQTTERVLATYTGRDPEDTSAVITRWSLTGTDAGDFTISENGQLTFRTSRTTRGPPTPGATTSTTSPSVPPTAGTTVTWR